MWSLGRWTSTTGASASCGKPSGRGILSGAPALYCEEVKDERETFMPHLRRASSGV